MIALGGFWAWLAVHVGAVAVCLTGLFPLVFLALYWRRQQARKSRQNPLTRSMLRSPGHSLRKKIDEINSDIESLICVSMMLPPVLCLIHLADSHFRETPESAWRFAVTIGIGVLFSIGLGRMLLRQLETHRRFRLGLEGELATGQELDQLMLEGCRVFHDIPFPYGNIDHVVISRSGVFTVNTKMRGKPKEGDDRASIVVNHHKNEISFPDFTWSIPTNQLETECRWLSNLLSEAVGEPIQAEPILALPGWFIKDRIGRGKVFVVNPINPKRFFVHSRIVFSETQVSQLAHHLNQLCRDVQPLFRDDARWERSS